MLIDSRTGKQLVFPKIHGNTKVTDPITGRKDRTLGWWRRAGREAGKNLVKNFPKQ